MALPLAEMLARDLSSKKHRNEAQALAAELRRESDAAQRGVGDPPTKRELMSPGVLQTSRPRPRPKSLVACAV